MPRKPLSPAQASANVATHLRATADAVALIASIIDGTNADVPDDDREQTIRDASKVLEAAGCYVRRQADMVVPHK